MSDHCPDGMEYSEMIHVKHFAVFLVSQSKINPLLCRGRADL
jgi:hypothetical protein